MHRAHSGSFRVRIEARHEWWRQSSFQKLIFERSMNRSRAVDGQVREMGRHVYHENKIACGSKEFNPPFPFPPRGKPGRGRFPPRRKHAARQQKALARIDAAGSPHKRAAAPLCIPRVCIRYISETVRQGKQSSIRLQARWRWPEQREFKDGRHVGLDFYDLLIEPIMKSILSGVLTRKHLRGRRVRSA